YTGSSSGPRTCGRATRRMVPIQVGTMYRSWSMPDPRERAVPVPRCGEQPTDQPGEPEKAHEGTEPGHGGPIAATAERQQHNKVSLYAELPTAYTELPI